MHHWITARHAACKHLQTGFAASRAVLEFTAIGCSVNSATGSLPIAGLVTRLYRLSGANGWLSWCSACRIPTLRNVRPKGGVPDAAQALWLIGMISAPAFSLSR